MLAIILSRRDFREYDQIISLYTNEKGKLDLLARGTKKITSKNSAHLEPFCYDLIEIAQGKEIDHLTKVVPIDFFAGVRGDMEKSMAIGCVAHLTNLLVQVNQPDKNIWELLLSWIKFVDKTTQFSSQLVDAYVVRFLSCLGLSPILDRCVVCGVSYREMVKEELSGTASTYRSGFYFAGGGLICTTCRLQKEKIGESIFSCGLLEISNMQLLLSADWRLIGEQTTAAEETKSLHALVYQFLLYHSEKNIEDWMRLMMI